MKFSQCTHEMKRLLKRRSMVISKENYYILCKVLKQNKKRRGGGRADQGKRGKKEIRGGGVKFYQKWYTIHPSQAYVGCFS